MSCACLFAACSTSHPAKTNGEPTTRADAAISGGARAGAAAAGTDAAQPVAASEAGGAGGVGGAGGGSRGTLDASVDAGGRVDAAHEPDADITDTGLGDADIVTDAGSVSSTHDGFACQGDVCAAGEVCVNCDFFGGAFPLICAPDPRIDAAAYDAAIAEAGCLAVFPIFECDGHEDCRDDERCVYDDDANYPGGACAPDTRACVTPSECIICRDDADCPAPTTCAEEPVRRWGEQRRVCS